MSSRVVSEFYLGDEFRSDFVVMAPFSGAWEIHFVELESVDAMLFNKNGTPKKEFRAAICQVDSWKTFCGKNRDYLVQQMSDACRDHDLMWPAWKGEDPMCTAGLKMTDPQSSCLFVYHIVIGRRENLTAKESSIKASYRANHEIDVASYDRLVGAAGVVQS